MPLQTVLQRTITFCLNRRVFYPAYCLSVTCQIYFSLRKNITHISTKFANRLHLGEIVTGTRKHVNRFRRDVKQTPGE